MILRAEIPKLNTMETIRLGKIQTDMIGTVCTVLIGRWKLLDKT